MDIASIRHGLFKGTIRLAYRVLENILTVHTHSIEGRETGNLLGSRIEIGNPPFCVRGEKPIRDAVQDLNKALFLVIYLF